MKNMKTWLLVIFLLTIPQRYCGGFLWHLRKHEKCIDILKCEPVVRLLRNQIIKQRIDKYVRDGICGFEGNQPKIFCDIHKIIPNVDGFIAFLESKESTTTTTSSTTTKKMIFEKSVEISLEKHPNYQLLDHKLCGPVSVETRIYGGSEAKIREFPWMALLAYDNGENDGQVVFRCGATIVNKNHVMTAAHCVTGLPKEFKIVGVRVGEHDFAKEIDCETDDNGNELGCNEKYQDFGIEEVYSHPNYSMKTLQNDIALIRLKGSIDFKTSHVRPICLPLNPITKGRTGIVTGWGSTKDGIPTSNTLQKVALPIVSQEKCLRAYRDQPFIKFWNKQICAGGVRFRDSCTGDSGGPLQTISVYQGEMRTVQFGIVSFGRTVCAVKGSPGVYTNVAHYVEWILDVLGE